MKSYVLTFTYPDGHSEEIQEIFVTEEKAVSYGQALMNQIAGTEQFKHGRYSGGRPGLAYFVVHAKDGNEKELVYSSIKM